MGKNKYFQKQKQMPANIQEPSLEEAQVQEELVEFEEWYAAREEFIPSHHRKEILKADFKGRGLGDKETMADFDYALKEYGVELE